MTLDTENTIYVATDRTNDEVRVLLPRKLAGQLELVHLTLDDPAPESTDRAEHRLLQEEMDETIITL